MTDRDLHIIQDATLSDEPYIVFRAQDILSTMVLLTYIKLLGDYVPGTSIEHDALERLEEFRAWQVNNPNKVKLPD
jgi:hypothetical protein